MAMWCIFSKSITVPACLSIALSMLSGCEADTHNNDKGKKAAVSVEVVSVQRKQIDIRHSVAGTLEASREVQVFNQEEGTIIELPYFEGDRIKKGDLLVRLDDTLIKAEVDKSVASHKQAKLDLKRLVKLSRKKLASEDQLAQAQTGLELARAEETLQRTRLNRTRIKAEFDGIVTARLKETGNVLPVHSHVLTLIDPSSLQIKVPVSELLLFALAKDDPVSVRIDALGDQTHFGKVSRIHPTVNPETRKGIVELVLEPVPPGAVPGQLCRISIKSKSSERNVVSMSAIRHDEYGEYVYKIDNEEKARRTTVQTGYRFEDQIEIVEGLGKDDKVVVKGEA